MSIPEVQGKERCEICEKDLSGLETIVLNRCGHRFHRDCFFIRIIDNPTCVICGNEDLHSSIYFFDGDLKFNDLRPVELIELVLECYCDNDYIEDCLNFQRQFRELVAFRDDLRSALECSESTSLESILRRLESLQVSHDTRTQNLMLLSERCKHINGTSIKLHFSNNSFDQIIAIDLLICLFEQLLKYNEVLLTEKNELVKWSQAKDSEIIYEDLQRLLTYSDTTINNLLQFLFLMANLNLPLNQLHLHRFFAEDISAMLIQTEDMSDYLSCCFKFQLDSERFGIARLYRNLNCSNCCTKTSGTFQIQKKISLDNLEPLHELVNEELMPLLRSMRSTVNLIVDDLFYLANNDQGSFRKQSHAAAVEIKFLLSNLEYFAQKNELFMLITKLDIEDLEKYEKFDNLMETLCVFENLNEVLKSLEECLQVMTLHGLQKIDFKVFMKQYRCRFRKFEEQLKTINWFHWLPYQANIIIKQMVQKVNFATTYELTFQANQ